MTTGTKPSNSGAKSPSPHPRTPADAAPVKPASGWAILASPKYLAAIAAVTIVLNGAAFYWFRVRSPSAPPAKRNQEMVLGTFEYSRMNPREKQVKHGQIVVTLRLAANLDAAKFRDVHHQEKAMQDAIEEAMRRLRASDLADPRFVRLKNHFQERLNEELGFDGIDEVMVAKVPEPSAPDSNQTDPNASEQAAVPQSPNGATDASSEAPADGSASTSSASAGR